MMKKKKIHVFRKREKLQRHHSRQHKRSEVTGSDKSTRLALEHPAEAFYRRNRAAVYSDH